MVGPALKKFAKQNNLTVKNGAVYGNYCGYNMSFLDGYNCKRVDINVYLPDCSVYDELEARLDERDLKKEFLIALLQMDPTRIIIAFQDTVGTVTRMKKFLDWFLTLLPEYGIEGADVCPCCGRPLTDSASWTQIDSTVYKLHRGCQDRFSRELGKRYEKEKQQENEQIEQERQSTSYVKGFFGAMLGSLLGAVCWAFMISVGYIAVLVGYCTAYMAELLYGRFHGRKGKGKVFILLFTAIAGIVIGTVGADVYELVKMINAGELPGFHVQDILPMIGTLLQENMEYRNEFLRRVFLGVVAVVAEIILNAVGGAINRKKAMKVKNMD